MAKPRTIAVVTGTRAEFGLLDTVMRAIDAHLKLDLQTVVTGTHLVAGTWKEVRDAGYAIDAKVRMQKSGAIGRAADVQSLSRGIAGLGKAYDQLKPDIVLVLGDRIEVLAAASAASVGGYRVAHLHGGDRAEGVADEAIRHAVTKLVHLHFPGCDSSKRRLIRLGENPASVFNHGSPAIDALRGVTPAANAPQVIVMQHPIGASNTQEARWMRETLAATKGYDRLILEPNHDPGRGGIVRAIGRLDRVSHLPRGRFLSLLAGCGAVVGNSSAGLIEAAALRVPCVNIGPRQAGREKPANVTDCDYGRSHITRALRRALKLDLRRMRHPYGKGDTGQRIAETLATADLASIPLRKRNAY